MIVELHINGKLAVELIPQSDIEHLVMEQMLSGASKGKAVTLRKMPGLGVQAETFVVEVER